MYKILSTESLAIIELSNPLSYLTTRAAMSEPLHRTSESSLTETGTPLDAKVSPSVSCHELDVEKGDSILESDEKALARYTVPVLEKGVKTALLQPVSPFTRFRVWYNPYRMVSGCIGVLVILSALTVRCLHSFLPLFSP